MKTYPLEIESVGSDTYIAMSRGHHDLDLFMVEAGTRGAWPATYCHEYGEKYKLYNKLGEY